MRPTQFNVDWGFTPTKYLFTIDTEKFDLETNLKKGIFDKNPSLP